MLAHNVYFTLKDKSEAAQDRLLDACRKYLSSHPGIVFFACGTLAQELKRPVNDREFDVALHVVFQSQALHDQYQVSAAHQRFIEENREGWQKVRVFDSVCG